MATGTVFRSAWLIGLLCLSSGISTRAAADQIDDTFADRTLRHCLFWMLTGTQGALIQPICTDEYQIPPPSLFLCSRRILTGFKSQTDLEACAIEFDEEAKKARAGYVRSGVPQM